MENFYTNFKISKANFLIVFLLILCGNAWGQTTTTITTTGTGNWTVPAGVTSVTVEVWGSGAGGGSGRTNAGASGGGGGGGAYAKKTFTGLTGGTSKIYYSNGAGGAGNTNGTGTVGTQSWANITNSAPTSNTGALAVGGAGGAASTSATTGGAGGAGGNSTSCFGDVVKSGGAGSTGIPGTTAGTSGGGGGGAGANDTNNGATATSITGAVGVSPGGSGASGSLGTVGGSATSSATSAGGGGAGGSRNGSNSAGGNGANGLIRITYTCSVASNVISPAASIATNSSVLTWTNPTGCIDEIMIVAATASNTGTPSGNGTTYTANLAYTSGTAIDNGYVVYKGTTSSQTITGLTNGTTYYIKFFTRIGTIWSSGTEITVTPALTYCTPTGTSSTYYISNVTTTGGISNITNTSTSNSGYGNFTTQSVSNYIGASTNFSLTHTATTGGAGVSVFIDWNNNGVFTDTNEKVLGTTTTYNYSPFTGSITIPAGTSNGNYRMRVVLDYNSLTPISCPVSISGETEDYIFAVVSQPDPITITPSSATICSGGLTSLTATSNTAYTYTWSPSTGLDTTSGATVTASPTSTTTYTVTGVSGSMTTTKTVTITVNQTPSALSITSSPATICNGAIGTLTASEGTISSNGTGTFGTGTSAMGTTSYPNPFSGYYGGAKHQLLFTAAELQAQGLTNGSTITQVKFDLSTFTASACTNLTIRMGTTSNTALTGFVSGTTSVYGPSTFTPSAAGVIAFTLTTPFVWNGTSNIVLETVHNAGNSGNGSGTTNKYTTTATNTVYYGAKDSVTGGISGFDALTSYTSSGASTSRPNTQFVFSTNTPANTTWSPTTELYTDAAATVAYTGTNTRTVYIKPTSNRTYTVTATNGTCTSTTTTSVTTNNVPSCASNLAPVDNSLDASISGIDLTWSAGTGNPTGYDVYFGTNLTLVQSKDISVKVASNQSGTTFNTGSLVGNTNYYWLVVPINNCGSSTCTTILNFHSEDSGCTHPTITATDKVNLICNGVATGSITVTAIDGTTPYQYSKDNGATYQTSNLFENLSAGTYPIKVKGNDGCESAAINVIITQPNALIADAGNSTTTCSGSSNTIGGSTTASGGTGSYTYSWSPATGLSATNIANPTATVTTTTTYTLTVSDSNGCQATSNVTLTIGSGVTKYWAGAGSGMTGATTGTDFNTAANWSSTTGTKTATTAPSSCDDVNITSTGAVIITLSQNTSIKNLTVLNNGNNTIALDVATFNFDILGNSTINANSSGNSSNKISIRVGNIPGKITFKGNADFGPNGAGSPFIGFEGSAAGNTTGTVVFEGNTSYSVTYGALTGSIGTFIWDGNSAQTISTNPTYVVNFPGNVQIGDTNSPTVQISTSTTTGCFIGANKNMTIKSGSTLNLNTKYFYPSATSTGILTIETGARLICGGTSNNGNGTNNFPTNFASYALNSNSTVEYNAATQSVNATPTYGNLIISTTGIKTAGGALTIAGNLTINTGATFAAGTSLTHNLAGNWTNNGTFSYTTGNTINFNGTTSTTINGSSTTAFNNITINKGTSIVTTLEALCPITSNGNLVITNGLFKLTHVSATPSHGTSSIATNGGIEINGGSLNGSNGTITNNGLFRLITGNATVGTATGNQLLHQSGTIDIQGGTYTGSSRIRCTGGTFKQSGGTITLCTVGNNSGTIANFDIAAATNLDISGGTLIIRLPNNNATPYNSINILNGGTKTITGGTIQIGDGSTTASQTFLINCQIPVYDFVINATTQTKTARLTNDLTINNDLTIEGGILDIATSNDNVFIKGDWINSGTLTSTNETVTFNGDIQQLISGNSETAFKHLKIDNINGVKSNSNVTVNGILNLNADNPDGTDGLLDMVIDYDLYASVNSVNSTDGYNNLSSKILTLGPDATIIGNGDATGKIRRTTFVSGTTYAFGNKNTQLTFTSVSGSALPTQITVVATRGNKGLHVDKSNAIKRMHQILRTGGESATRMTIRLAYQDDEINSNDENNLVLWDHHIPYAGLTPHEHGKTNQSATENWVELSNHGLLYLEPENDATKTKYWMISNKLTTDIMWIGSAGGAAASAWTTASNWTSGVVPTATTDVVIPSNTIYQTALNITSNYDAKTIDIKPNAVVNAGAGTLTLHGGPVNNFGNGTWNNQGTFNAGTSTVVFNYAEATIAGNTTFNNIVINSNKKAIIQGSTVVKIAGTITNNGIFDASSNNTVEYVGSNQSIAVANGTIPGYNHLVVNQINNTDSASLNNDTEVRGNLVLTNGLLNLGAKTLTYSGNDISKTNGFIKASDVSSTMNFINTSSFRLPTDLFQSNIYNLTINGGGILLGSAIAVSNELNLTNGNILLKGFNFTYSGNSINKVNGQINGNELNSKVSFENTNALTLPANVFVNNEIYDMTVNGLGGTTLGSETTINNQLELTQGNLNIGANTLTLNGPYISGTPNNLKAISTSNVNFNNTGSGSINLPNFTAVNTVNFNSRLVFNASENASVYGDVILTSGTLQLGSYTFNRNTAGGNFKIKGTSTLKIGGTNSFPSNYDTHEVDATTTVDYNGTNQNVKKLNSSQNYGYLALSGTGTKSFDNDIEVENNLTNSNTSTARVANGKVISVKNQVINNGIADNFIFENNSSLIQTNDIANVGPIKYKRTATQRQLDYVYWASPVVNFNLSGHASNGPKYYWNPTVQNANGTQGNWTSASGIIPAAKGVIVRGPSTFTTTIDSLTVNFAGVPKNGATSINITRGTIISESNINDNWNLLGNPYPSAISAKQFLLANSSVLRDAVYIWNHGTPIGGYETPFYQYYLYNYNPNDYSRYNLTGFSGGPSDDYYIGAGQGFFVAMVDGPTGSASVSFTNSLRNKGYGNTTNTNFFRNSESNSTNTLDEGRIWLNLVNSSNFSPSRTLIGYKEGATNGKDNLHDAIVASDGYAKIYSMTQDQPLIIQGRQLPFNDQDRIPIGYDIATAGNYSIAIHTLDGLFTGNQNIYLEDLTLNVIHDLKQSPYQFSTATGVFRNRFILRFTNSTLGNNDFEMDNSVVIYTDANINIKSAIENIKSVQIFDLLGRTIATFNDVNNTQFMTHNMKQSKLPLLVKVTLENGLTKTYKIIY